jgi:hypothetical protein
MNKEKLIKLKELLRAEIYLADLEEDPRGVRLIEKLDTYINNPESNIDEQACMLAYGVKLLTQVLPDFDKDDYNDVYCAVDMLTVNFSSEDFIENLESMIYSVDNLKILFQGNMACNQLNSYHILNRMNFICWFTKKNEDGQSYHTLWMLRGFGLDSLMNLLREHGDLDRVGVHDELQILKSAIFQAVDPPVRGFSLFEHGCIETRASGSPQHELQLPHLEI